MTPGAGSRVLSARSARTLYNVADTLFPPDPADGRGGADFDLAPFVDRRLRWAGVGAARVCWVLLACIEWQPLLTLRGRSGFSWLPRERRRRMLERWEHSRLAARRRALARLRGCLAEALAEARALEASAPPGEAQFSGT